MPAARLFRVIDTVTLPGVVPLGVTESQLPPEAVLSVAVNGNAPLLLALIATLCAVGSEPRLVKLKVSGPGCPAQTRFSVGSAATLKVTGMVTGLLEAPAEASVMLPVYWPAVRLPGVTETETPVGVVALPGVTDSQLPLDVAIAV